MARFHFSLERVLRWRSVEFAREEAALDRLVMEQLRLQTQRAGLSAERSKLHASLGTMPDLRGQDLRAVTAYALRLRRQDERLQNLLSSCEQHLAEQRNKYREAKQRLRLLEELKARKFEEWRYDQSVQLESLASESFLANWNRRL